MSCRESNSIPHLVSVDGPGEVCRGFGEVGGAGEKEAVSWGQEVQAGHVVSGDLGGGGREDDDEEVSVLALGPEDRGLGGDLAPVPPGAGHGQVGQLQDRGVALVLSDGDARPGEDGDGLRGAREEPEDLQASLVPLDAVHLLPLTVVLTHQPGALSAQTEGRNLHLGESEGRGLLESDGEEEGEAGGPHGAV